MFDFLRNLTKSAEEKRQETVAAYLDGGLSASEQRRFEQELAQDATLRIEVGQLRLIKESLRQLPQREVPRNFILDPAQYGRPTRQPWIQAYPVLRTATALAAFFFIFALAAGIFTNIGLRAEPSLAPAADVAQIETVGEAASAPAEDAATFAFRATEVASDDVVNEGMADEESPEDGTDESTLETQVDTFEEEVEEAEEEMMEEAEETEEPPTLAPQTTEDSPTGALNGEETTADEDSGSQPQATPTLSPTTVSPTPTVSTLPRVTPPTPLPERELELEALEEGYNTAGDEVAVAPEVDEEAETQSLRNDQEAVTLPEPINTLFWIQVGLGLLLLTLAGLTFYARRQR